MLVDDQVPFDIRIFEVFIDGKHSEDCIQADDEEGWAIIRNGDFELVKGTVHFEINVSKTNHTEIEIREAINRFNRKHRPNHDPISTLRELGLQNI